MQVKLQSKYGFMEIMTTKGKSEIGNACWIGDNVIILPNVNQV
ncbi:hypothetical protein EFE41_08425 [Methanohalophilus portucalensis FDF-1]|uniref:Uncharacterized protein n=1 Tax=Methanohalophilus portucalensis FDF-1 TaxID=523843 RepID=A0A3M9L9R7_9EURY|nr:hypothetical protein EFE41_08425 [Methanohalophilus portucalensis FDF-1]